MKSLKGVLAVLIVILISTSMLLAQGNESNKSEQIKKAEQNYLKCLQSEYSQVKISAIFYLGDIKSQVAVSDLIYILRYDKNDAARLVSALSLIKIGDPTGIAEVKKIPSMNPPQYTNLEDHVLYLSVLWNQYLNKHPKEAIALKGIKFEFKSDM